MRRIGASATLRYRYKAVIGDTRINGDCTHSSAVADLRHIIALSLM